MEKNNKKEKVKNNKEAKRLANEKVSMPNNSFDELTHEELRKMFYEFQNCKNKLEKQNKKLLLSQIALNSEKVKFDNLYNQESIGYLTISEQGIINGQS